jgi:hypothetical protein
MGKDCDMRDDGDNLYGVVRFKFEHTPNSRQLMLSLGGTMLNSGSSLPELFVLNMVPLKGRADGPKGEQHARRKINLRKLYSLTRQPYNLTSQI